MNTITMWIGDVRDVMADLPDGHADLLATSPPFWQLRSYLPGDHPEKTREIGAEPTPAAFIDTLYELTAEWRRLVPPWGSIAVELGDTMSGSGGGGGDYLDGGLREGQPGFGGSAAAQRAGNAAHWRAKAAQRDAAPDSKSMCLIPHLYTIGLAYGHNPLTGTPSPAGRWRVRNVVAWARPNPPVGSLGKRNVEKRTGDQKFRPATSYITIACTGTGRYFDLDAVRTEPGPVGGSATPGIRKITNSRQDDGLPHITNNHPAGAPPLDWHTDDLDGDWLWKLATAPYKGAHYAAFNLTLPRRMVLAMCPQRVCEVCGWPSERITESQKFVLQGAHWNTHKKDPTKGRLVPASEAMNTTGRRQSGDDRKTGIANGGEDQQGFITHTTTTGWTDCGHNAYRPGRVLDPFGGSGTTAVAAALEGRDAVLIDIDARNIDLVHRRLTETVRIVRCVETVRARGAHVTFGRHRRRPTTVRVEWTVTPAATSELVAIANGQPSLFDPPKEIA